MILYTLPGKVDIVLGRVIAVGPTVKNVAGELGSVYTRRPGFTVWLDGASIKASVELPLTPDQWKAVNSHSIPEDTIKNAYTTAYNTAIEERAKLLNALKEQS